MADLITTKMKLKDAFPDLAGDFDEGAEFVRKGLTPADLKIEEGERAIVSYITTAAKDRDNEIVLPSGADLKHYRKNPVVLFGHDYRKLPIGKNMWIKSDEKGLIGKTAYANHDEAEKVYQYRKDGFPLAVSIGFIPLEAMAAKWTRDGYVWDANDVAILEKKHGLTMKQLKGVRVVYTKWTMLEYSDVAVPSNPEALQLAKSKGLNVQEPEEKAKVTVWDTDGNVVQVDTESESDAVMTLETDISEAEPKDLLGTLDSSQSLSMSDMLALMKSFSTAGATLEDALGSVEEFIATKGNGCDEENDTVPPEVKTEEKDVSDEPEKKDAFQVMAEKMDDVLEALNLIGKSFGALKEKDSSDNVEDNSEEVFKFALTDEPKTEDEEMIEFNFSEKEIKIAGEDGDDDFVFDQDYMKSVISEVLTAKSLTSDLNVKETIGDELNKMKGLVFAPKK